MYLSMYQAALHCRDLSNNKLSGPINETISALTNLNRLYLSLNVITGKIPPEISKLRKLSILYVTCTLQNGTKSMLRAPCGCLAGLRFQCRLLNENKLTGTIPETLSALRLGSRGGLLCVYTLWH